MYRRKLFRVRWSLVLRSGREVTSHLDTDHIGAAEVRFADIADDLAAGRVRGWVSFARGGLVERISNGHGTLSHRRPVTAERMAA